METSAISRAFRSGLAKPQVLSARTRWVGASPAGAKASVRTKPT